jgi:hypothetical protein
MGVKIVRSIIALCRKFHGDLEAARHYLGKALEGLHLVHEDDTKELENPKYIRVIKDPREGFDVEEMYQPNAMIRYVEPRGGKGAVGVWQFIDYMWEVDADECRFGMSRYHKKTCWSGYKYKYWSWKSLCKVPVDLFKNDAEINAIAIYAEGELATGDDSQVFEREYSAILIQAAVRRFLLLRKALCPPDGVLYRIAKNKFEHQVVF